MPSKNYKLTETYINQENGSIYDAWISSGAVEPSTSDDITFLKSATQPGYHQQILSVNSAQELSIDVTLQLLEVRMLTLTPLV